MNANHLIKLKTHTPYPIAKILESVRLENDPRNRSQRIIDLFEFSFQLLFVYGIQLANHLGVNSDVLASILDDMERPSMGIWKDGLIKIAEFLRKDKALFLFHYNKKIHGTPLDECLEVLCELLGHDVPIRPKVFHLLDLIITLRNDRFAHGTITKSQADLLVDPLEKSLYFWIQELDIFFNDELVYISRIEWRDPVYHCVGMYLNGGISIEPYHVRLETPIRHDTVFLIHNSDFIELNPYVKFYEDEKAFYIYNQMANSEIQLRCPFDVVAEKDILVQGSIYLNYEDENSKVHLSLYHKTRKKIKDELSEEWLTKSQEKVWNQYLKINEPPYYVVNIYGVEGSGKTFLGWLIEKKGLGRYINEKEIDWSKYQGADRIVLDQYDTSRRSLRSLRTNLHNQNIRQAVVLSREKARDDIPCLELQVTKEDIDIVKANLYREFGIVIPDDDFKNLEDCFRNLEDGHD